jgi:hypothetical protein
MEQVAEPTVALLADKKCVAPTISGLRNYIVVAWAFSQSCTWAAFTRGRAACLFNKTVLDELTRQASEYLISGYLAVTIQLLTIFSAELFSLTSEVVA